MSSAVSIANRCVGPAVGRWLRARVVGAGLVPRAGGVLLAANHRSFLDHFLLGAACPRAVHFLGKAELGQGLVGRVYTALGMVPVQRGSGDMAALDAIGDLLRAGAAVGVFPEGTRSPTGELFRFRSGVGRMAAAAQVPVVPVGLVGTAEVWPRGERPPARRPAAGVLEVRFGAPLAPPADDGRSRRAFTAALQTEVAGLCEQPQAAGFATIASVAEAGRRG